MSLTQVFSSYTQGKGDMDSRTFVKLLKETGVIDKAFTQTDADIIYTKVKAKGAKRLTFTDFETAIEEIAKRKKKSVEDITNKVCSSEGPKFTGTAMEAVRFYDDKTLYTGVHAHGGPSTLDKPMGKNAVFSKYEGSMTEGGGAAVQLQDLLDRSTPNIRGVNQK